MIEGSDTGLPIEQCVLDIHLATALKALAVELSPALPTEDGLKKPDGPWKRYQTTPATEAEVRSWYRSRRTGNGLVTGYGNLECLEFDDHLIYERFREAANKLGFGDLITRIETGYSEATPGGGIHWLYRCETLDGNTKLAERPNPTEKDPDGRKPLIETRGIGGFVVTAPSNGKVHPSGGAYKFLSGGLDSIATISSEEREALFLLARTFDEIPDPVEAEPSPWAMQVPHSHPTQGVSPLDDFKARARLADIIEPFGWQKVFTSGGVEYCAGPTRIEGGAPTWGKTKGFRVFTSSTPLEAKSLSLPYVYCKLKHNGDWKACVKDLAQQGFGTWIDDQGEEKQNPAPSSSRRNGQHQAGSKAQATPGSNPKPSPNGTGQTLVVLTEPDIEDVEILDHWPRIDPKAFHGFAGELVAMVEPHTEADPVAILMQFLVGFGNAIGREAHFSVGATRHYLNLFIALIGATAVGRKGTSWDIISWFLALADLVWAADRIQGGLVSGEGLIYHVRDAVWEERETKDKKTGTTTKDLVCTDAGVADKRLLVVETEMGRMLKAMNRETNTLSDVIRQAWDTGQLRTLGKHAPAKATNAHVSLVCHATQADIRKHLTETDSANGFANRFWWISSRRSKVLPDGGDLGAIEWTPMQERLIRIVEFAREPKRRMTRDTRASKAWHAIYEELSSGRPGLVGKILSRAEAQVMRAACLYALLDMADQVRILHLEAAVAAWEFNEASTRLIFGEGMGDPDAEKLLKGLKENPQGLTRSQINADIFKRNKKASELGALLSDMLTQGLIHRKTDQSTGGRAAERWYFGRGV